MKKQYLFIIGVIVLIGSFVIMSLRQKPYLLIDTNPKQNQLHNPFLPVTIKFNRKPKLENFSIIFEPKTEFTTSVIENNSIQITPKTTFLPETQYKLTIISPVSYELLFTSEQIGSNTPGWNEQFKKAEEEYRAAHGTQDDALTEIRASVPVEQPGFTITYAYKNNTYTVTLDAPYETNKRAFLDWMTQKGVTDFSTVRIEYINK